MAWAYYNENNAHAADYLENVMRAGFIAPGFIDRRSIRDVEPGDLAGFTQHHFFAGMGVWSYALRAAGWQDTCPVWTGSCPCQPFSGAGKRQGAADDRHLWPVWWPLIEACRPDIIFGEQVAGKDGYAWWDIVSADLDRSPYAAAVADLAAAGAGSPHIRQRLYWVAVSPGTGPQGGTVHTVARTHQAVERSREARGMAVTDGGGQQGNQQSARSGEGVAGSCSPRGMAYGKSLRWGPWGRFETVDAHGWRGAPDRLCEARGLGVAASWRHRAQDLELISEWRECSTGSPSVSCARGLAYADHDGRTPRELPERQGGCEQTAPQQYGDGENSWSGALNGVWRNADWLGCTDERWRPVAPGSFPLVDGFAGRVGALRTAGNAICAPLAAEFIKAVMEWYA